MEILSPEGTYVPRHATFEQRTKRFQLFLREYAPNRLSPLRAARSPDLNFHESRNRNSNNNRSENRKNFDYPGIVDFNSSEKRMVVSKRPYLLPVYSRPTLVS